MRHDTKNNIYPYIKNSPGRSRHPMSGDMIDVEDTFDLVQPLGYFCVYRRFTAMYVHAQLLTDEKHGEYQVHTHFLPLSLTLSLSLTSFVEPYSEGKRPRQVF